MNRISLAAGISALAILVAGCGSSSSDKPRGYADTGKAISDLCASGDAATKSIAAQLTGNAKHDAPLVKKLVDQVDSTVKKIKAIKPNDKLKSAFATYTSQLDTADAATHKILDAANSGDDAAYKAASQASNANTAATHRAARALGATVCASD